MSHSASFDDLPSIQAAMGARGHVLQWATGAELLALIEACERAGWLSRLREAVDPDSLAALAGVERERVDDILAVLVAAEVVEEADGLFSLSAPFAALTAGASGVSLDAALGLAGLQRTRLTAVLDRSGEMSMGGEQALTLARAWGMRPTQGSAALYGMIYAAVSPLRDRLAAGGTFLDVGCGIGGALLITAQLFDEVRAVGLEIVPEIVEEARRRAKTAGLDKRVEVRCLDARALSERDAFDAAYWAQEFFDEAARAEVLAAILRALRPGGLLMLQELFPDATTTGQLSLRAGLDRLFYRGLGARYGASAQVLVSEATAAGFAHEQTAETPLGKIVLMRRP
jgi:SAM-dependent methyltransferase